MPDEASICLNCFTEYKDEDDAAVLIVENKVRKLNKRQIAAIVAMFTIMLIALPAIISYAYKGESVPITNEPAGENERNGGGFENPLDDMGLVLGESDSKKETQIITEAESSSHGAGTSAEKPSTFPTRPGYDFTTTANHFPEIPGTTAPAYIPNNPTTRPSTTRPSGNGTTSPSTRPPVTTTRPPSTTQGTTAPDGKPVYIAKDFEYEKDTSGITITKYKGRSRDVLIPNKIDGKNVTKIEQDAFNGNNYVQTVTFEDSDDYHILTVNYQAFHDCYSLRKIRFPRNTDLAVIYMFAYNCTSLVDLDINHWQYKFENGMLYYDNLYNPQFYYYCEGYKAESYTQPKNLNTSIFPEEAFGNNKYLKRIYLNGDSCITATKRYPYLEGIYANGENYFDVDGVMFERTDKGSRIWIYPAQKKDKTFTFPENCHVDYYLGGLINQYVETFVIPSSVTFSSSDIEYIHYEFTNLKTVKIGKDNPYLSLFRQYFKGKIITF